MSIISKWNTSFKRNIKRFGKDEGGQFAIMFAITGIAVTLAGGVAVDTARLYTAKTKLDNAVDAAILATTRDLTTGKIATADAQQAVKDFLLANTEANGIGGVPITIKEPVVDKVNKTVAVEAHLMLPMTLTAIAGYNELKVASTAKAQFSDERVEIAMALDVTGSMGGSIAGAASKIAALKSAATDAINTLVPAGTSSNRVRIGLVPYSASVNIGSYLTSVNYTGTSNGCVAERTTSKKFTDDKPTPGHPVFGTPISPSNGNCPTSQIQPMTSDNATLTAKIASLSTGGYTAGHVGIAWAQYMLSSKWNAIWPGDSVDGSDASAPSDSNTRKFAIIMTDGEFNTFLSDGSVPGHGGVKSRLYAEKLCTNMKNGSVKVFTINFAGGTQAENLMKKCASPDTTTEKYFFNANDGNQLKEAFDAIAKSINTLKLIG